MAHLLVLCTCPPKQATTLATQLVKMKLAACVNITPAIQSIYWWKEQVEQADESLLIIKTTHNQYKLLEEYLQHHHPYDCPEIIGIPIEVGLKSYLHWLTDNIGNP